MVVNTNNYAPEPPNWLEIICKSLYRRRKIILGTSLGTITLILLPIVTNLVSSLLTTPLHTADNTLIGLVFKWMLSNLFIVILLALLIVVLATLVLLLIYLGHLFEEVEKVQVGKNVVAQPLSDLYQDCEERYLQHLIAKTTTFVFRGIPLTLVPKGIQLDKIFISLQFCSTETLLNYPMNTVYRDQLGSVFDREEEDRYFKAEMNWQKVSSQPPKISVNELWHMLRKEQPAVLIQGNPGAGKSILMARLVLSMARSRLNQPDLEMSKILSHHLCQLF